MADNNPNGTPGLNKLARVMTQRSQQVKENGDSLILDIGSIQGDMSLLTNTFPIKIPQGEYHVCRLVNGFKYEINEGGYHGTHVSGDGYHTHISKPPALKKGDRVLVAWIQNEAVVIDVIDATE